MLTPLEFAAVLAIIFVITMFKIWRDDYTKTKRKRKAIK